ncbi:glycosyltransferase [Gordonia terrae]|uniref:glycosyltransferase n=1 Tax=Gordonia terrae TaxID=2055 RepID=UPI003F6D5530
MTLRCAREVWVTTDTLAEDVRPWASPRIVRPGIKSLPRSNSGRNSAGPLVWAGRLDVDKRPGLFAEICERTGRDGRIFGDGPLRDSLAAAANKHCELMGWAGRDEMWEPASLFVGTSYREAFGRSAVEASLAGVPIVVGHRYGAAAMLVTDPDIRRLCVVESSDPDAWAVVVGRLLDDPELLSLVAEHVHSNAQSLSMAGAVAGMTNRFADLSLPARKPERSGLQTSRRMKR